MANNIQQGFPVGYSSMLNNPQPSMYMQQQTPRPVNIQWVQGMNAAKAYMMEPNTTMALWDSESQNIYLKTTDMYGRPIGFRVLRYDFDDDVQYMQANNNNDYVTRDQFNDLMREVSDVKSIVSANAARFKSDDISAIHAESPGVPGQPKY